MAQQTGMYDTILKGGYVIDPANEISGEMDIAILDGKIARVAKDIPASSIKAVIDTLGAKKVIDVSGYYITPGLIDIGAHSVTHPLLANLDPAAQREEIHAGKTHLEALLGWPVTHFSYPNGSFSRTTRDLVRDSGFRCACTSRRDVTRQSSDPFKLPRFWVENRNGKAFARWLRWWLNGGPST